LTLQIVTFDRDAEFRSTLGGVANAFDFDHNLLTSDQRLSCMARRLHRMLMYGCQNICLCTTQQLSQKGERVAARLPL